VISGYLIILSWYRECFVFFDPESIKIVKATLAVYKLPKIFLLLIVYFNHNYILVGILKVLFYYSMSLGGAKNELLEYAVGEVVALVRK